MSDNTQMDNIKKLSDFFHADIVQERKVSFGRFMTIIDALGLSEVQHKAVKQLIAKQIDERLFSILDIFDAYLNSQLGYKRDSVENVENLVREEI